MHVAAISMGMDIRIKRWVAKERIINTLGSSPVTVKTIAGRPFVKKVYLDATQKQV